MTRQFRFAIFCLFFLVPFGSVSAVEPGWSPAIIATGSYREQIRAMPMEQRPYRPLHFYGNTVRRIHYRGTPLPIPRAVTPLQLMASVGLFR